MDPLAMSSLMDASLKALEYVKRLREQKGADAELLSLSNSVRESPHHQDHYKEAYKS